MTALVELYRTARDGSSMLVVASDEAGAQAARAARLALGRADVGLVLCDVPPTLYFVTIAALRMLPPDALALAPALVDGIASVTVTSALLPSVAGLRRPRPGTALDVASYLPGTTFRVDWTGQTVASGRDLVVPESATALVVTRSEKPVGQADEQAWPEARVDLETDGRYWGAKRWLEVTALTMPIDEVVSWVLGDDVLHRCAACPTCGRPVAGEQCVFCQVLVASPATEPLLGGHV